MRLREEAARLDWPLFARVARRHRVEALAWAALKRAGIAAPPATAKTLSEAADATATQNLHIALESQRLKQLLEGAGIPVLFLKGISLGALSYGTVLLKAGWDIDILVPSDAILSVAGLLRESGYAPLMPAITGDLRQIVDWHRQSKESVWRHAERRMHVELHSALTDYPELITAIGIHSPRQDVPISASLRLPTFAKDELFAYLCVHGASSAWFRLKWIADLSALLASHDAAEIGRLYDRAQALGAGRAADLALLLSDRLFGSPVEPALIEKIGLDWVNHGLIAAVEYSLTGRSVAREILDVRFGTLGIHLCQFGLRRGLRYKLGVLRHELPSFRRFLPTFGIVRRGC